MVRSTRDGNLGTVHVHLSVADVVEPGPSHDCVSILDLWRRCEGESLIDAVTSLSTRACNGCGKIAHGIGRAATDKTVNDLPAAGVFQFSGVRFVGERNLARASTVHGGVGTTSKVKLQRLRLVYFKVGDSSSREICSVAREVVATWIKRVFDGRARNGRWCDDVEVSVGDAEERGRNGGDNGTGIHVWRECDVKIREISNRVR